MRVIFDYDYYGQTLVHPIGLTALLILGVSMLLVPRRYAAWPMIVMACFISPAQRIAIFSLNFDFLRIMVLFGSVRLLLRGEWRNFSWRTLDLAVFAWAVVSTVVYVLFWAAADALKYKLGVLFDIIGMYFLFRCLIRDWSDVDAATMGFALVSIPVSAVFLLEHSTGRNIFAVFGGVPEFTVVRDGRLRCQGAFAHAILAGCFWASVLPLMCAQFVTKRMPRALAAAGIAATLVIVVTCASSTPVMAVVFVVVGFCFFPLRNRMPWIRWGLVVLLVSLHMVMKQPVWHLIGRIDIAGGSTGYHRFLLIDRAIANFDEWWLLGTDSTERWQEGLFDVTNQYILEGVRGGIWSMGLFVLIVVLAFRNVGRMWRASRQDRKLLLVAWACGVCLFVHAMNFIGVAYFGQINMVWYMTLAAIASLAPSPVRGRQHGRAPVRRGGTGVPDALTGRPMAPEPA